MKSLILLLFFIPNSLFASTALGFKKDLLCLKKLVCSNFISDINGNLRPSNIVFFNENLVNSCNLPPSNIHVQLYEGNNVILTIKGRSSIITNCSSLELGDQNNTFKNQCDDIKVDKAKEIEQIASVSYYEQLVDGKMVHKCDNPNEIFDNQYAIDNNKKFNLFGLHETTGVFGYTELYNEPNIKDYSCIDCNILHPNASVSFKRGPYNTCITDNGCPLGFKTQEELDSLSNKVTIQKTDMKSIGRSVDEQGNEINCFNICENGEVLSENDTCINKDCDMVYNKLTSHLVDRPLPMRIGKCNHSMIKNAWKQYVQKSKAIAQKSREKCEEMVRSSEDQPISPLNSINYSSINFAKIILPICGLTTRDDIENLNMETFNQINIKDFISFPGKENNLIKQEYGLDLNQIYLDGKSRSLGWPVPQ